MKPPEQQEGPQIILDVPPEEIHLTDLGNSRVFAQLFGKNLRWCGAMPGTGWMVWERHRWRPDDTRMVHRLSAEVAPEWIRRMPPALPELEPAERKSMGADAAHRYDQEREEIEAIRDAYQKHARKCESASSMRAMVEIGSSHERIAVRKESWDRDIWLFNTPDYTYDPRTMTRYPPRREDLITRSASVGADPEVGCPLWLAFLDRAMGGDAEMVAFLQRAVGYSLTGDTGEHCLFIAYGHGSNGKSTFIEVVSYLLGDYATTIPVETFINRKEGAIPNDLAALAGARLVVCSEPPEGGGLDEGLIKLVTGGDLISARFLNREFFTFKPAFKLWFLTNHKPIVKGTDEGIWRRLRLVPFEVEIPKAERDTQLGAKLKAEACGIMQWAIQGLKEWRRIGLAPPAAVLDATEGYKQEMDILGDFLADKCNIGESLEVLNKDVYAGYQIWAKEQGLMVRSQKWLSRALSDRKFKQDPSRKEGRKWIGLTLVSLPVQARLPGQPDPALREYVY